MADRRCYSGMPGRSVVPSLPVINCGSPHEAPWLNDRALPRTGRGQNPAPNLLPPVTTVEFSTPFRGLDQQGPELCKHDVVERRSGTLNALVSATVQQCP